MNSENTEHLITMANQIASNMAHGCTDEQAKEKVKTHIGLFWALPMRKNICSVLDSHQSKLDPIAYQALMAIKSGL